MTFHWLAAFVVLGLSMLSALLGFILGKHWR